MTNPAQKSDSDKDKRLRKWSITCYLPADCYERTDCVWPKLFFGRTFFVPDIDKTFEDIWCD